ncbi:MAG TPA: hypothetical protein VES42_23165, partial [Pilimelia sp.]|nr:hypothetical protein [Pilimelia sp.]
MLRPRLLAALLVAGAGLATALWLPTQRDSASAADAITWRDEFNATAGTPVDSSKWAFETGGSGFGNKELQFYTNSTRNAVQARHDTRSGDRDSGDRNSRDRKS